VTYNDADGNEATAPVAFGELTEELAKSIGSERRGNAFFAFLPTGLFMQDGKRSSAPPARFSTVQKVPRVMITAFDESGEEIGQAEAGQGLLSPTAPVSLQDLEDGEGRLRHFLQRCKGDIALDSPQRPECETRPVFDGKPGSE